MMKFVVLLVFAALPVWAQAQSRCDQARDPHSFACADATFTGQIFPIARMNNDILMDNWTMLTYSDISGTPGPEFMVLTNPQNPRIPEGIVNTSDRSKVGLLNWNPQQLQITNWGSRGHTLSEVRGRTVMRDTQTVETFLANGQEQQGLQCRMFLRSQNDHLLCRWFTLRGNQFVFRGYLGFLRTR